MISDRGLGKKYVIVFLAVNSSYSHFMLSYAYLRAISEKFVHNWDWVLVEGTINDDEDRLINEIASYQPDIIVSTLYLFNHEFIARILKSLRSELSQVSVFFGGPEFLGENQTFLRGNPSVDAVFRGDESSFPTLLRNFADRDSWMGIPGLCYLNESGDYVDGGCAKFAGELDELPSAFSLGYIPNEKPFLQIETSRGCPGKCIYCTSSLSASTEYFSLGRIRSDLKHLQSVGIGEIRVIDRTFNYPSDRALELLKLFKDDFPEIRFHLEIDPRRLTEGFLEAISGFPVGQLHLEAGTQTFNSASLRAIKRGGTLGKLDKSLSLLSGLKNIEVHADLIAGLPEQSFGNLVEDIEKLVSIGPSEIQLETLKVLPGTALQSDPPSGLLWNSCPPYELTSNPWMDFNDLDKCRRISRMIDIFYNHESTHSVFRFAVLRFKGFVLDFLKYCEKNALLDPKPSLEIRLEGLKSFAESNNYDILPELADFAWLATGLSSKKLDLNSKLIQKKDYISGKSIWRRFSNGRVPKRFVEYEFSGNVAELWFDPSASFVLEKHKYRFLAIAANQVSEILQLKP